MEILKPIFIVGATYRPLERSRLRMGSSVSQIRPRCKPLHPVGARKVALSGVRFPSKLPETIEGPAIRRLASEQECGGRCGENGVLKRCPYAARDAHGSRKREKQQPADEGNGAQPQTGEEH